MKPRTVVSIATTSILIGLLGILVTDYAITPQGLRYEPALGWGVAVGLSLIVGAGTVRSVVLGNANALLSQDSRQVVLALNVITAHVSIALWCLYVLVSFSSFVEILGLTR